MRNGGKFVWIDGEMVGRWRVRGENLIGLNVEVIDGEDRGDELQHGMIWWVNMNGLVLLGKD